MDDIANPEPPTDWLAAVDGGRRDIAADDVVSIDETIARIEAVRQRVLARGRQDVERDV